MGEHDSQKLDIVYRYYKHLLEVKIISLNHLESIKSHDVFENNITHSDLNRMLQLKQITHDIYNELINKINHHHK